jgi:hypothetical protein
MDPVTAIGVASSAITFLEFSYSFLRTIYGIYNENKPLAHEDLEKVALEMEDVSTQIIARAQGPGQSPEDVALISLAKQCNQISTKAIKKIAKTKPNRRNFIESLTAALKTICTQADIELLQAKLENCRGQLHLQLHIKHRYVKLFIIVDAAAYGFYQFSNC